ncbi:potassium channel family protein [Marivita hallyeonensis]|uniref:Trk system potassium uptake protein TrkA n=1 Tax=Marivita hallyeonensis TaxID=996342 RepID=A0A1M5NDF3_9RHOB|nr:TrkA family potassium uptake protein [Marivita hallyeonensis]SHG87013.1 trk system potassium uptake protein TrkA [Marivita hallyeonensis]
MTKATFAVIGLSTFGSVVAKELERFGNHVIGVDIDEAKVGAHSEHLSQALIFDARDDGAMREAGIDQCEVGLVAIGSNIETSILAAINLKTVGVKKVWAKAGSKNHHRILSKLGVDRVIRAEKEVGQHVAQMLNNPLIRDYVSLGNGLHIVNFTVPESLEGKELSDLSYAEDYDLRCLGVMRGTEFIGRDGEACTLQKDDLILMLGRRSELRDFAGSL